MKKNNIKKIALTLALLQTISLGACSLKDKNDQKQEPKVHVYERDENKIYAKNGVIYNKHIDIYSATFLEYNKSAEAVVWNGAGIYDLDGNYIEEIPANERATILKESKEQSMYLVRLNDGRDVYICISDVHEAPILNNTQFYDITDDNQKIVTEYTYIYDINGNITGFAAENFECTAISTNGEYTLIKMGENKYTNSSNIEGYIENQCLLSKFNKIDFYAYANEDAKAYCEKELIHEAYGYNVQKGQRLEILFMNDKYACMSIEDGTNCVYLPASCVDVIERKLVDSPTPTPTPDMWFDINAYHYLTKNAYLFGDTSFNNPGTLIDAYQKVYVIKSSADWSYVMTDNGEYGYMEPYLLYKLPEDLFVEVDISDQTTKLYSENQEIFTTYNVTGKDSTPTDIGYFDIDEKVRDTYLRSWLPNGQLEYETFVSYWMPYNGGEGLHDAPWQNGHFGDTEWHHSGGSHGCVNMPSESASTIYDNVEVGTRVLVHK